MKTKLVLWLISGIVLMLGPVWGVIGTVIGMILCFCDLSQPTPDVESLANNIHLALYATIAGFIACPIGIIITIISALKLGKVEKLDT